MAIKTLLRPITQQDVTPLIELARKHNHELLVPTHVIERDGRLLGSISMDGVPMCSVFVADGITPLGLRSVFKQVDQQFRDWGDKQYFVAVKEGDAGYHLMPTHFHAKCPTTLWYKQL